MTDEKPRGKGAEHEDQGIENEGTGSLRLPQQKDRQGNVDPSTKVDPDKGDEGGAREGYEDHGGSRDENGTGGESSGSRPKYQ